jgi:hypothetical protein
MEQFSKGALHKHLLPYLASILVYPFHKLVVEERIDPIDPAFTPGIYRLYTNSFWVQGVGTNEPFGGGYSALAFPPILLRGQRKGVTSHSCLFHGPSSP